MQRPLLAASVTPIWVWTTLARVSSREAAALLREEKKRKAAR